MLYQSTLPKGLSLTVNILANLLTVKDIGVLYSALDYEIMRMEMDAQTSCCVFDGKIRPIEEVEAERKEGLEKLKENQRYLELLSVKEKMNDVYVNFVYHSKGETE